MTDHGAAPETTILIADDHSVFRGILRDLLEEDPCLRVIGEAHDGDEAWRLIEELQPGFAILDVEMPKCSGIEVARRIREKRLPVRAIMLTMYGERAVVEEAMSAGAQSVLLTAQQRGLLVATQQIAVPSGLVQA